MRQQHRISTPLFIAVDAIGAAPLALRATMVMPLAREGTGIDLPPRVHLFNRRSVARESIHRRAVNLI
jgi:hypothetical protein